MSSIMLLNCIKGLIVYLRKPKLEQLLKKINELDEQSTKQEEITILNVIINEGQLVTKLINIFYFSSFPCLAFYNIMADYDERFWSSTAFYPYDFARKPCVYCTVFVFQALANFSILFMAMATDTYPALFCGILASHVDVLRYKLRTMGTINEVHKKVKNIAVNTDKTTVENETFRKDLIASVEYRKDCLRYVYFKTVNKELLAPDYLFNSRICQLMENSVSESNFCQIGLSALILCTATYQLSEVSIVHVHTNFFLFPIPKHWFGDIKEQY